MKQLIIIFLIFITGVQSGYGNTFEVLLQDIKAESTRELSENTEREKVFSDTREKRFEQLRQAKVTLDGLKRESDRLSSAIDTNEEHITELEESLHRKMGDLGELFGCIRQISGELKADFEQSMVSVHFPERTNFLGELSEQKALPDIQALEKMWVVILEELNESGKVSKFISPVVQENGTVKVQEVFRIGTYGAVSQGSFLTYSVEDRVFAEAMKQPPRRYLSSAGNFESPQGNFVKIMVDPTRGQLLQMLSQKPDLKERIRQGGIIGYIIIGLGITGFSIGLTRYGYLTLVMHRIKKQALNMQAISSDNPLGRIASIYSSLRESSREQKEIILEESVLKEIPEVEKYNTLIKMLAAVSPLLGLLGTVTGMIITFQSITLFGTSDPKLMAGGISTALITTVLGLCTAIPLLFVYTFIATKSKNIIDVIEHQSVGLIAKEYN